MVTTTPARHAPTTTAYTHAYRWVAMMALFGVVSLVAAFLYGTGILWFEAGGLLAGSAFGWIQVTDRRKEDRAWADLRAALEERA
jgi:hypothetical protein